MASSVVSDVRSRLKNGNLDYESLVIFTEEPPLGEDHFTVVKRSDILNIPVGVKADARLSNQFRLTGHVLNFFAGKGRTPTASYSFIFSRVEKGYGLGNAQNEVKGLSYFLASRIARHNNILQAYQDTVQMYYEGLPKGMSFATEVDPKWRRNELGGKNEVAVVSAPEMDEVNRETADLPELTRSDAMGYGDGDPAIVEAMIGNQGNFYAKPASLISSPGLSLARTKTQSPRRIVSTSEKNAGTDKSTGEKPAGSGQGPSGPGPSGQGTGGKGSGGDPSDDSSSNSGSDDDNSSHKSASESSESSENEENSNKSKGTKSKSGTSKSGTSKGGKAKGGKAKGGKAKGGKPTERTGKDGEDEKGGKDQSGKGKGGKGKGGKGKKPNSKAGQRPHGRPPAKKPRKESGSNSSRDSSSSRESGVENLPATPPRKQSSNPSSSNPSNTDPAPSTSRVVESEAAMLTPDQMRAKMRASQAQQQHSQSSPNVVPKRKTVNRTGANKAKFAGRIIDNEVEDDTEPAFVSDECQPGCRCMHMTLAEIRNNCKDPIIHQLLAYITRLHNSMLSSHLSTRKEVGTILAEQIKMKEELKINTGYSEAAASRVTAKDLQEDDIAALGLKWTTIDQVDDAVHDPMKKKAMLRLLNSGMISHKHAHVVPEACDLFFDDYLLDHLLIKAPSGKGKNGRIIMWGEEYFLLPSAFTRILGNHCKDNCHLPRSEMSVKLTQYLNEGRVAARHDARERVLNMVEQGDLVHPMYKVVYMDEMCEANLVNMPMPADDAPYDEKQRFANTYFNKVFPLYEAWQQSLIGKENSEADIVRKIRAAGSSRAGKRKERRQRRHRKESEEDGKPSTSRKRKKSSKKQKKQDEQEHAENEPEPANDSPGEQD